MRLWSFFLIAVVLFSARNKKNHNKTKPESRGN